VALRLTHTPASDPFCAQTCTVQVAALPAWMLAWEPTTLMHRSAGGGVDAAWVGAALEVSVGVGLGVATGRAWHWELDAAAAVAT
jgi:hypothetical protein